MGKDICLSSPDPKKPDQPPNDLFLKRDRSNRMDLHFKMILREFRGYYVDILRSNYNYIIRKKKKTEEYYACCIEKILEHLGFRNPSPRLIFFLGALV